MAPDAAANETGGLDRIQVFWLEVFYLVALAVLAWAYFTPDAPKQLRAPATFGPIPSGVLWFGALGGVLISLAGIHEHRYDWDPRYWTWHFIRPFVGALIGAVAVIIVMAGILAIGVVPVPESGGAGAGQATPAAGTENPFPLLIAFVVGYRETHFRDLIKRLGDVLFTSKEPATALAVVALDPVEGPAAGGTPVRIAGTGLDGATAVRFGSVDAEFQIISGAQIDAVTPVGTAGVVGSTG